MKHVYVLTNTRTGKKYVGSTSRPDYRYRLHINALKRGNHPNKHMQADYVNGDEMNFEIVDCLTDHGLKGEESAWMIKLRTYDERFGYNVKDWSMQPIREKHGLKRLVKH